MTENEQRANEIATSIMHEGHIDKNGYNQRRDLERAALMMAETKDKEITKLQQALSTVENNNIAILRKFDKYKMESDRAKADLRAELVKYKTAAFSDKQSNAAAADAYLKAHHTTENINDNDYQNAMNIAVVKAFVAACEWKDGLTYTLLEHHKKEHYKFRDLCNELGEKLQQLQDQISAGVLTKTTENVIFLAQKSDEKD